MKTIVMLMPDLILALAGTVVLLAGAFRDDKPMRDFLRWMSLLSLGITAAVMYAVYPRAATQIIADGWLCVGPVSFILGLLFLSILAWIMLASSLPDQDGGEWFCTLLFTGLGMLVLSRSNNLAALFLGVEVLSLSLYVLIAFRYVRPVSLKAATMYLVLTGVASGLLVFGLALVYAHYGSLDIPEIVAAVAGAPAMPGIALVGFGLFLSGLGFKLAAVPFHMWAPDVYEAAPSGVSGLIASAAKGAVLAALVPFAFLARTHWQVIWFLAAASMLVGNLLALRELRVKRLLAYSSIGHVGYMLIGFLAGPAATPPGTVWLPQLDGVNAMIYYVFAYALSILGAFAVVGMAEADDTLTVPALNGMGRRKPLLAACLLVFVIGLAGLPPTAGFLGKLYLFTAGVRAGYIWLVIIGLLGSAIGIYYYLRIVVAMFMQPPVGSAPKLTEVPLQTAVLLVTAFACVLISLWPDALWILLR